MTTAQTKKTTVRKQTITKKPTTIETSNQLVQEEVVGTEVNKIVRAIRPTIDDKTVVAVKNGFQGKLIYKETPASAEIIWEEFGNVQDFEFGALKRAKNSQKAFFENNWFLIDDPEIIEALGVEKYYQNGFDYETFDTLFDKSPEEVKKVIDRLPKGQLSSVAYRARRLIDDKKLYDISCYTISY